eukprot:CAMPEP_0174267776 /NCGR_PEP_ID=MMETSP0439-20130205/34908_1 /TAXON_ID=0 /ORGANISM="Stereomyxa ramosa, Strain Chinc5" /LENGTH=354 /DNA_ID=CAMNT_0015355485 /DNA_START=422 /DNA_END=1486 /DNA_ORIENTATION=+
MDKDLKKWLNMVERVRKVNRWFASRKGKKKEEDSLYSISVMNPFNYISIRKLSWIYGVSNRFWDLVVVSVYSSSFLTVQLDAVPAIILPVLDDLISLGKVPVMDTWSENSGVVFAKMTENVEVHSNSTVIKVVPSSSQSSKIITEDADVFECDIVIMACNAKDAIGSLDKPSCLESSLLSGIDYTDDDDNTFLNGVIHSDKSVLPHDYRNEILNGYSNSIRTDKKQGEAGYTYENTFVLSSWVPSAQHSSKKPPMLVTYSPQSDIKKVVGHVINVRAHPHLSVKGMIISMLMRLIQGRRGVYYCGSYTTPGNGHDLSLLSGLVVAKAIGADYPFADNQEALKDFKRLQKLMGLK